MKALKIIGIILGGLLGIFLIVSLLMPSTTLIERTTVINAPAPVVFENVNNIRKWNKWSYWMLLDTAQIVTYAGPESGVGASYSWDGKKTMKGTLTITESAPSQNIKINLDFAGQGTGKAEWKFEAGDGVTNVTETFTSDLKFTERIFPGLMMDKFLGAAFEEDLKNLKALCESTPAIPSSTIEQMDAPLQWVILMRDTTNYAGISPAMGTLYGNIGAYIGANGATPAGYPLAIWYQFDKEKDIWEFEAGMPVKDSVAVGKGMRLTKVGGKAVKTTHYGAYEKMEATYNSLSAYMQQNALTPTGPSWEVYVTDPMAEKDTAKWQTDIYFPL